MALAIDSGLLFSGADTSVTGLSLGGGAEGAGVALGGGAEDAGAVLGGDEREGSASISAESFSTRLMVVFESTRASAVAADTSELDGTF